MTEPSQAAGWLREFGALLRLIRTELPERCRALVEAVPTAETAEAAESLHGAFIAAGGVVSGPNAWVLLNDAGQAIAREAAHALGRFAEDLACAAAPRIVALLRAGHCGSPELPVASAASFEAGSAWVQRVPGYTYPFLLVALRAVREGHPIWTHLAGHEGFLADLPEGPRRCFALGVVQDPDNLPPWFGIAAGAQWTRRLEAERVERLGAKAREETRETERKRKEWEASESGRIARLASLEARLAAKEAATNG